MSDRKLRVIIADDHAVVRSGLRAILEDEADIEVVGEVGDGHAAIRTYPARPVTAPPGFLLISEYVQPDGGVLRLYERTPAR